MGKTLSTLFSAFLAAATLAPSAASAQTPSVGGPYELPYSCLWNDRTVISTNEWTVEDKNNDNITWGFSSDMPGNFVVYNGTAQKQDADDWLVSPYLSFEAGKAYKIETGAYKASGGAQKVSVAVGTGDDPTTYKVVAQDVNVTATYGFVDASKIEGEFIAPTTGSYRVAFHCTSSQRAYLLLLPVKVFAEESEAIRPAAVTDLKVEVGAKGAVSAKVSFTTPTTDYAGNPLTALSKVQIYRDGSPVAIKGYESPALGQKIEWQDETVETGEHTYTVVSTANDLRSDEAKQVVYVGHDKPLPPQNIKFYDNLDGTVRVTWDALTENSGAHGGYLDASTAEYCVQNLYYGYLQDVAMGLTSPEYTLTGVTYTGTQSYTTYVFTTYTDSPTADTATVSDYARQAFVMGKSFPIPYNESFSNKGLQKGPWLTDANYAGRFGLTDECQDDDAGALVFDPSTDKTMACLQGPKVDISNAGNPQIVFWYYAYPKTDGKIRITVNRNGQEEIEVGTVDYSTLTGSQGWRSVAMDLTKVNTVGIENGYIRPYIYTEGKTTSVLIDNIKIFDAIENNLSAELDAPAHVQNGKVSAVNVKVSNLGTATASGYKVNLYVDGQKLDTYEGEDVQELAPNAEATYEFAFTPKLGVKSFTIRGEVEWAADGFQDNNVTSEEVVEVVISTLPAISDLAATAEGKLTWSAMNADGALIKDDFETYTPWSITRVGDWTLFDKDKAKTNLFGKIEYPHQGEALSYIVFNPWNVSGLAEEYIDAFTKLFAPHSGKQSMMSTGVTLDTSVETSDWLITPELSGEEQTISFWVNAPNDDVSGGSTNPNAGPETFDVYYSEDDNNANSFIKLNSESYEAKRTWQEFKVQVPEGAKYFAIVHTCPSTGTSYGYEPNRLCVDDVTYRAGGLRVMGYNVYRDGELVKKLDGKTTTWTDDNYTDDNGYGAGNHKYNVIVVYANGESNASNTAYVGDPAAGVETVVVDNAKTDARVYSIDGKYVGKNLNAAKKGVYVQNGKKVVVK